MRNNNRPVSTTGRVGAGVGVWDGRDRTVGAATAHGLVVTCAKCCRPCCFEGDVLPYGGCAALRFKMRGAARGVHQAAIKPIETRNVWPIWTTLGREMPARPPAYGKRCAISSIIAHYLMRWDRRAELSFAANNRQRKACATPPKPPYRRGITVAFDETDALRRYDPAAACCILCPRLAATQRSTSFAVRLCGRRPA